MLRRSIAHSIAPCSSRSLVTASRALLYPRTRLGRVQLPSETTESASFEPSQSDASVQATAHDDSPTRSDSGETIPWYVEYNRQSLQDKYAAPRRETAPLPKLPADAPASLLPILTHLSEDVGLVDLAVLDLRHDQNDPWGYGGVVCVLATAPRAERQLQRAVDAIKHFLRATLRLSPRVEGLDSLYDTKVKRRRRKKMQGRTNLQRFEAEERLKWIFIDCGASVATPAASTTSGGGGGKDGARILLQLFTPDGREEYDLEDVYAGKADMYFADQTSIARASDAARIATY